MLALVACTSSSDVITDSGSLTSDTSSNTLPTVTTTADGWMWPLAGLDGHEWVINNYVDLLQGSPAMEDYKGGSGDDAKTYNDHRGIDIDISSFRAMDEGVGIRAVVGGEVVDVYDGHFDRETSCDNDDWNAVFVESDDGYLMYYGHMRNGSMSVEVGDRVERGDTLGLVGSSGCSSGPHLHFEVWAGDVLIDPFQDGLWASPPVYDTPASLMAGLLEADGFLDFLDIQDPGDQATAIQLGQDLGFGVSMAGGEAGDRVLVEVSEPGGQIWETMSLTFDQTWRHSFWYWNRSPDRLGKWQAAFFVNGELSETHTFELE